MAGTARLFIDVIGSPGHAGTPHLSRDALLAAAMIETQLQTVVSRRIDPLCSALLHSGKIQSGESRNIVAGTTSILGTVRWLLPELRPVLEQSITEIVNGIALQSGCQIEKRFEEGYPVLINDKKAADISRNSAKKLFDKSCLVVPERLMLAEDMAFYLEKVPGCFSLIGAAPRNTEIFPHHHPEFDICDESLKVASSLLAQIGFDAGHDYN